MFVMKLKPYMYLIKLGNIIIYYVAESLEDNKSGHINLYLDAGTKLAEIFCLLEHQLLVFTLNVNC